MIDTVQNIFIVGIKGVAMANLAIMLKQLGKNVTGVDTPESFITDDELKKNNITFVTEFSESVLPANTELVIYSAAHGGKKNPIVKAAVMRNVHLMHQVEVLNELMKLHTHKIAVCGSHGKTTTTALLAFALKKIGVDPSYIVGSSDFSGMPAGHIGKKDYFVVEADEYAKDPPDDMTPKFFSLDPNYIICTNIDFDHPDVFKNLDEVRGAFNTFFEKVASEKLFMCEEIDTLGSFKLSLYGEKNVLNAAGVIALLLSLGFTRKKIADAIADFKGVKRRFELVFSENDSYLLDDYAHHPAEILATISAAHSRFPGKKIHVIFQPHTFSRTVALKKEFTEALSQADFAYIAPIFASAREQASSYKITHHELATGTISAYDTKDELLAMIKKNFSRGNVVFTMGAGDIYKLKNDIIDVLKGA